MKDKYIVKAKVGIKSCRFYYIVSNYYGTYVDNDQIEIKYDL